VRPNDRATFGYMAQISTTGSVLLYISPEDIYRRHAPNARRRPQPASGYVRRAWVRDRQFASFAVPPPSCWTLGSVGNYSETRKSRVSPRPQLPQSGTASSPPPPPPRRSAPVPSGARAPSLLRLHQEMLQRSGQPQQGIFSPRKRTAQKGLFIGVLEAGQRSKRQASYLPLFKGGGHGALL